MDRQTLEKSMRKRSFGSTLGPLLFVLCSVCAVLFALYVPAEAQQADKIPRIGYLSDLSAASSPAPAFMQGLHDLGYIEGKNIDVVFRTPEGKSERYSKLVGELIRLKVDVIVATATAPALATQQATKTIPIVMANADDPVRNGLVGSLPRPGGNITGLASIASELGGKRIAVLKEVVPKAFRMAVLYQGKNPVMRTWFEELRYEAKRLGVALRPLGAQRVGDFETLFESASRERYEGLLVLRDAFTHTHRKAIADLATKHRLPAVYPDQEYLEAGGFMVYGPSLSDLYRRTATYVDEILKGTKPADLPVERPSKFELLINLKTAKRIGLTIPPNVLAKADRIIR
jgi:putative tryptophan/tyrosine transport system substrate-binding protein